MSDLKLSTEELTHLWQAAQDQAVTGVPAPFHFAKAVVELQAQRTQPRIVNKDNASAFLEEKLWEFIDTAAAFPDCKPDDRTWDHVLAYKPKHVPIPAFALEGQQPSEPCESTQPEATAPAQDLSAAILDIEITTSGSKGYAKAFHDGAETMREAIADVVTTFQQKPLSAGDRVDAERYRWLCEDHADPATRERRNNLLEFFAARSYSANSMCIDAAILQSQKGGSHG